MLTNFQKSQFTQLMPNVYIRNRPQTLTIQQQLSSMRQEISHFVKLLTCNLQSKGVQSDMRASPPNLENCITNIFNVPEEANNDPMAHGRVRVYIGNDANGNPVYTKISGSTQDERNDNIVKAYIQSGRIFEFLPDSFSSVVSNTVM